MLLPKDIEEKSYYWAHASCFDKKTRAEVSLLIEEKKNKELLECFYKGFLTLEQELRVLLVLDVLPESIHYKSYYCGSLFKRCL